MFDRYEVRPETSGWTVYDVLTDQPVSMNGLVLGGLGAVEADDVVFFLNRLYAEAASSTLH